MQHPSSAVGFSAACQRKVQQQQRSRPPEDALEPPPQGMPPRRCPRRQRSEPGRRCPRSAAPSPLLASSPRITLPPCSRRGEPQAGRAQPAQPAVDVARHVASRERPPGARPWLVMPVMQSTDAFGMRARQLRLTGPQSAAGEGAGPGGPGAGAAGAAGGAQHGAGAAQAAARRPQPARDHGCAAAAIACGGRKAGRGARFDDAWATAIHSIICVAIRSVGPASPDRTEALWLYVARAWQPMRFHRRGRQALGA